MFICGGLYSQCDTSLISEKLYQSNLQSEKLKCQLESAKTEIIKQKTLKWIAVVGGAYVSTMIFIFHIKKD